MLRLSLAWPVMKTFIRPCRISGILNTYNIQYKYNLQYNTYNIQCKYIQHTMTTIQLQCSYNDNYTTTTSTLNTYKDYDENNKSLKSCCGSEFYYVMAFYCFESANLHRTIIVKCLSISYASGSPHDAASICLVYYLLVYGKIKKAARLIL